MQLQLKSNELSTVSVKHIISSPYRRLLSEFLLDVKTGLRIRHWDFHSTKSLLNKSWQYTKCCIRGHKFVNMRSYEYFVDKALNSKTKIEFEENYTQAEALANFRQCAKCQQIRRVTK